jgi:hypothetical protein
VQWAPRVQQGLVVLRASEGFKVFKEFLVQLARRGSRVPWVLRVLPEPLALKALLVRWAHKVRLVR